MHPCLNVDEIVRLIACELVASGGKAAAVALACCCRSFGDPVLDVLWATLDRLPPLLKSLPGDVWNEGGCTSFKRFPTTLEWARFRKSARRMRELRERGSSNVLSQEVFSVMQLCTTNESLFPNLKTLNLRGIKASFIPFIPLFLSPSTTVIGIAFDDPLDILPNAMIASMLTTIPKLCPNLQTIVLSSLPRAPMITASLSGMLLGTNRRTLQELNVDCPLTDAANQVIYKLTNLCSLSVVIERNTPLPSASLPNLTELTVSCDEGGDWPRLFHGATLGKLESVTLLLVPEQPDDPLGVFERVALSSSIQNTLSKFNLRASSSSWNQNYSSLLPFTQLVDLTISFTCGGECSSTVDDDIVIDLARAMPKLEVLGLGGMPCRRFTTGVTAKGLVALAQHCRNLSTLRIHFQVASLSAPPSIPRMTPNTEPTAPWMGCALNRLIVGRIPVPARSVLPIALTLARIFPRIESISHIFDGRWDEVEDAIRLSKQVVDCSRTILETDS